MRTVQDKTHSPTYDFVIIGSGFGGSVSAMRLAEKGYSVLVVERGKRYRDEDHPRTNWNLWKYLWMPAMRMFGILQLTLLPDLFVVHGSGVGGGSLVYAAVLMEPEEKFFKAPTWGHLADWKAILAPHYAEARRMLGVAPNPHMWPGDLALKEIADELGRPENFRPTEVGVYFGEPGEAHPDPYFNGHGPERVGCNHCGGCMVGCRYNAKNTLNKNYLYFAEQMGTEVLAETIATAIRPLEQAADDARFEIDLRTSTRWLNRSIGRVRARNVVVAAGVLGTMRLLLRCRDELGTLPELSDRLGDIVRSNSEAFGGAFARESGEAVHSQGVAISSILRADEETQIEPVRFSPGSSLLYRIWGMPLIALGGGFFRRLWRTLAAILRHPLDFLAVKLGPGLTEKGTGVMVMQTRDNLMQLQLGRSIQSLFRKGVVSRKVEQREIPLNTPMGHHVIKEYARKIDGSPYVTILETTLNVPMTAHLLGGCVFGENQNEGVIDVNCQAFNYPGLYIIDGSIIPANPGVNPSLTITALAEYAMSNMPPKS